MDLRWLKDLPEGVTPEQREKEVRGYRTAFRELKEVLEKELKEYAPDYDTPSWAYKQADQNGYNRAIRSVLKLIKQED